MLRLAAFRPSSEKVTKLQLHPTYPWLVSADLSGNVVVWDWQHRQVIYEVNAIGVDERRLAGAQLQGESEPKISKLSQAIKDIKGGSVKHIKFYDDDVRYWQGWLARAAVSQSVTQDGTPPGGHQPTGPGPMAIRGRHFLVICCDSKAIFLDMVSMRAKDVPKLVFDNKSPLCVEFLPRSGLGDGPLAAFGGPDGVIRVLSMQNWLVVQRFAGAHKGPIACLKTFLAVSGETLLVSGGNDGLLTFWSVDNAREATPKLSVKGHDGGVVGIELIRVQGGPPQLVTIGADKTMAVWDTLIFKEMRRLKPISKMSCTSVATWSHPRAPNLSILTCAKDSHIWTVEHYGGVTRPLCDLTIMVPPTQLPAGKKLKTYCLAVHPLQPHLVAAGTNFGVILCEFDAKAVPAVVSLPTPVGSKEHRVICNVERELRLLTFQLSSHINPTVINAGDTGARFRAESPTEAPSLLVKQTRSRVGPVANDSAAVLATSHSGKYVSVVWPELPAYEIYRVSDWYMVDRGVARHFAWDSCKDRYALLQTVSTPKVPPPGKTGSSRKAREAAAAHAAAVAASAAAAAAAAKVEVRILLDDGSPNLLMKSIEGRSEPVIGLQGGALLGVAYKFPRKTIPSAVPNSIGSAGGFVGEEAPTLGTRIIGEAPANFQLYSWENFKPVSQMLPQPEWTAWDQTVEYCALAYQRYIVIAALRPQYRFLGTVAIGSATGGVWHRRQLFISTPTTIECVFVDAGVSALDLERKRRKEEQKAQIRAVAQHGELALLTVDAPTVADSERVALRPPMLQVVRLASFHTGPAAPPVLNLPKPSRLEQDGTGPLKELEERRGTEVAIGGGGVSMAVSRLPQEQKRPVGPLAVVGVRDGVLWLVDMFMTAHAIALSHPGIRCRCLAAYGDAVSAVKWASRLGREHHDDLAQFMVGMGYASEALHLPGISKRLEFDLAIQSGDLKRALQALITLSNSKGFSQGVDLGTDKTGVLSVATDQGVKAEAVIGIVKFAPEFLELIDAADATGQGVIAHQALTRLAAAGSVEGGLSSDELRALSFRLAAHGELTRLAVQANRMISAGLGREAALTGAFLSDPNLLEKAWEDTGMFPEATLHAQAHGRSSLKNLMQQWNKVLQKQYAKPSSKALPEIGATVDPVLAALEGGALTPQKDGVLQSLSQSRQPLIQILPPGNVPTAPVLALPSSAAKSAVPGGPMLALPAPATGAPQTPGGPPQTATAAPQTMAGAPPPSSGVKEPDGSTEGVPQTVSTSNSDAPGTDGVVPQPAASQASQELSNAPDLEQLASAAKTASGADAAQSIPSSRTPSAGDLMQLTSSAADSTQGSSLPLQTSSGPSSLDAALSLPLGASFQAFPPQQAQPVGPSFQAVPSQPSQSLGPGFQGFPSLSAQPGGPGFNAFPQPPTQPLTSNFQSFPPQPSQPYGPGFQAFFPQSSQSFGSGFQSFPPQSTQPLGPGLQAFPSQSPQQFGTGFQAFPPSTQPAFGSGFQAFPPLSNQSVSPSFHAFPPPGQPGAPSFQAVSPTSPSGPPFPPPGQSGAPSFQAFLPTNPSGAPFPQPGQPGAPSFQAVPSTTGSKPLKPIPPPTTPPGGSGRHRSFPPGGKTGPGGGAQFPFPMSTSTSVGGGRQQFPFPMSTSTSVGGFPPRGPQTSSDLQLVPVGVSTAPQDTSSDKQLVPISSPAEPQNDRPFF
ncbi:unnamed protein product [Calypogeia fissa]